MKYPEHFGVPFQIIVEVPIILPQIETKKGSPK
jgi:hypothetical protein